MDPDIAARIQALAEDHTRGATALTREAAEIFAVLADVSRAPGPTQFLADLAEAGRVIMAAQPAMASLFTLANTVLHTVDASPVQGRRRLAEATARAFAAVLTERPRQLAEAALTHLPPNAEVVTHSASAGVEAALVHAHANGRLAHVVCAEARPLNEGVGLAGRLAAQGIRVTLVVDAVAPGLLAPGMVVLVGADTVSPLGVVNKAGTYPLALAARAVGAPVVVLAGSEKRLPGSLAERESLVGEARDAAELLADAPTGVTVLNRAFDLTPLDAVTYVISEDGAQMPADVLAACAAIDVHPLLR